MLKLKELIKQQLLEKSQQLEKQNAEEPATPRYRDSDRVKSLQPSLRLSGRSPMSSSKDLNKDLDRTPRHFALLKSKTKFDSNQHEDKTTVMTAYQDVLKILTPWRFDDRQKTLKIKQQKEEEKNIDYPLRKYNNGWNKQALQVANWKRTENSEYDILSKRKQSNQSWLNDQSIVTDSDFAETLEIKITNQKYLERLVHEVQTYKKHNKAQFLGLTSSRQALDLPETERDVFSLPSSPLNRSVMGQSHLNLSSPNKLMEQANQERTASHQQIPKINLDYGRTSKYQERKRFCDPLFPNVNYNFSNLEMENTDWFTLVHKKNLRRQMKPPTLFNQQDHNSRMDKLTQAQSQLQRSRKKESSMKIIKHNFQSRLSPRDLTERPSSRPNSNGLSQLTYLNDQSMDLDLDSNESLRSGNDQFRSPRSPQSHQSNGMSTQKNTTVPASLPRRPQSKARIAGERAKQERFKLLLSFLLKFKEQIPEPIIVTTPINLKDSPKYRKYKYALIIKKDHDRIPIIDFLLANIFKTCLLLHNQNWIEAFMTIYASTKVINFFNEFVIYIKHALMLVIILQKLNAQDKADQVLEYLRDVAEDTNNYREAIDVYEHIGKSEQNKKFYNTAMIAFKRMLQLAWLTNDSNAEVRAYQHIALQHFYLQNMKKAQFFKLKAFYGDLEDQSSICVSQAYTKNVQYKTRIAGQDRPKIKPVRQNRHVERTAISKLSSRTIDLEQYAGIKLQITAIQQGKIQDLSLESMLAELTYRKVGERPLRMCSPLDRGFSEQVPSPKFKKYKSTLDIAKKPLKKTTIKQSVLPQLDTNMTNEQQAQDTVGQRTRNVTPAEKFSFVELRESAMQQKRQIRAAAACRLQINRLKLGRRQIDYLKEQKVERAAQMEPVQPYNWQDIVQRSKMRCMQSDQKTQTYISHLMIINQAGASDSKKKNKQKADDPPIKKKAVKVDEKKQTLLKQCEDLVQYMSRMRYFPYVCQTEVENVLGIKVIRNFYTDEQGNTYLENE